MHFLSVYFWLIWSLSFLNGMCFQICNGATFVIVDKVNNPRDDSPMLVIQGMWQAKLTANEWEINEDVVTNLAHLWSFADDGGGMDPEGIRRCMSLGFSSKGSKKTIGQCRLLLYHLDFELVVLFQILRIDVNYMLVVWPLELLYLYFQHLGNNVNCHFVIYMLNLLCIYFQIPIPWKHLNCPSNGCFVYYNFHYSTRLFSRSYGLSVVLLFCFLLLLFCCSNG